MAKQVHDAAYFRAWRAKKRLAVVVAVKSERLIKCDFPAAVLTRGRVLSEMMRTPGCMWPAEWRDDA